MPHTSRPAVRLFSERAERYREQNLAAAHILVANVEVFGGPRAGLILWARLTLRREQARLNRLRMKSEAA